MLRAAHLLPILFLLQLTLVVKAQDVIYLNTGDKVQAIVKELSGKEIKYKNFTNPDGPTYVISKNDVVLIEYQNGTIEVLNYTPKAVSPTNDQPVVSKKEPNPTDMYYYAAKNCIYLNGLALTNSDIALLYDREIAKSKLSLVLLGAYNFNVHTNYTNRYIQALGISKKNYDLGIGINYYTQTKRRSQYFVGLMFKAMHYEYIRETTSVDSVAGVSFNITKSENVNDFQFSGMIVNGLQFRITPFFTYRAFIGIGATNKNTDISKAVEEDFNQKARSYAKAYVGMCIGYRFY